MINFIGECKQILELKEAAKKVAELTKKVESCKREVKQYSDFLDSDIRNKRDTTSNRISLKYASDRLERAQNELSKAQSEYNRLK